MKNLYQEYIERFENLEWIKKAVKDYSVEELEQFYYECLQTGLIESSIITLRELCIRNLNGVEQTKVIELLNKEIFMHDSDEKVKEYYSSIIYPTLCQEKMKKNVLFHLYGWLYGGAERAISRLINELVKEYNIFLVAFSPVENNTFFLDSHINFMEIKQDFDKVRRLYKLVRLLSPDVFVGNNNSIPEFIVIYEWLENTSIKTIAYSHEYYFYMHQNSELCDLVMLKNYYLGKADVATFLTSFSTNAYSLVNNNGARIPNPLPFDVEETSGFRRKSKQIIAVGRWFDYIKRIDLLLEAFKGVLELEKEAELTVVGEYNLDLNLPEKNCTVKELIEKLGLNEKQLHFVGNQTNVLEWYKKSDVLVMTSDNEGFSMVLIEAQAVGVPCVLVDIPGLEDVVENGKSGYIVKRDANAIAEKVVDLLNNDDLREKMSMYAQKYVRKFEAKNVSVLWKKIIEVLLSGKGREELNSYLKNNFRENVIDMEKFSKLIIDEYENNLSKIVKKYE